MDINGVKEYGKLMDKMQVAYTNLVATMEWELFRRGAYSGFLDDIYMRKVSAILDRQSPLPTHVLAEKAHISPKCIHRTLKKLEEKGLIERSKQEGNKKTQYISLTESAKKDMKTHSENSQEIMQSIFNGALSENERMQMLTATETLLNIFEKCCAFADTDNEPVQPAHVHFSYDLTQHVLSSKTSPFANRKNKKTP